MQDHFTGAGRARAFGAYGSIGAFSAVIAPLVGGSVIAAAGPELGWRLVVGLNLPSAIVVVVLALWLVPAAPVHPPSGDDEPAVLSSDGDDAHRATPALRPPGRSSRASRDGLDVVGLVLITLAVLALLVPFVLQDASVARRVLFAAPLAVVVPALALWERRYARSGRVPVLAPELVRSPGYVLGCLVATFSFGQALGYSAVLMLFLQDGLGLSPVQAGLVTTPGAVVSGVVGNLSWRVLRRWGRAGVTASYAAKVVTSIAVLAVVLVVPERGFVATLVVAQVITGALAGLSFSPNQTLTLEHAAPGRHGVAAGALQLAQRISSTVCLAAMTGAYVAVAGPHAVVGHPGATTGHRAALAVATAITIALAAAALGASVADDMSARRRRTRSTVVSMLESGS
jgi:MFS family permease